MEAIAILRTRLPIDLRNAIFVKGKPRWKSPHIFEVCYTIAKCQNLTKFSAKVLKETLVESMSVAVLSFTVVDEN